MTTATHSTADSTTDRTDSAHNRTQRGIQHTQSLISTVAALFTNIKVGDIQSALIASSATETKRIQRGRRYSAGYSAPKD